MVRLSLHAASTDYETRVQVVTFDPTDIEQDVSIPILSDGIVESAEEFFGQLSLVEGERRRVRLGQINSTSITILDSDGGSVANVVRVARGWEGGGEVKFRRHTVGVPVGVQNICCSNHPSSTPISILQLPCPLPPSSRPSSPSVVVFQLAQQSYSVREDVGMVNITVIKVGESDSPLSVLLQTQEIQFRIAIARGKYCLKPGAFAG